MQVIRYVLPDGVFLAILKGNNGVQKAFIQKTRKEEFEKMDITTPVGVSGATGELRDY